jgi:hypothetical protein
VPVGGGTTEIVAKGWYDMQDIAVDATSVYVLRSVAGTLIRITPK